MRDKRVAVVGAGPAGAAAAIALARAGVAVTLYEKSAWPREKACGDGLTPATVGELARLGLRAPGGLKLATTRVSAPSETSFRGAWPAGEPDGTTCERREFDDALVRAAVAAGARFEPQTAVALEGEALRLRTPAGDHRSVPDAIVLAEGATGGLAAHAGLPPHRLRLHAYRGYVETPADLPLEYGVHYAREFLPGYAWIFPVEARRANVGAVLARRGDVRARLAAWLGRSPLAARELGSRGATLSSGRGGIIPVGRARRTAGNVFAIGDAAGVADPLSAEGVSQSLASARLFADAFVRGGGDPKTVAARYEPALRAFDDNAREALRMRAVFRVYAEPLVALARWRPRLAAHVIATGYFPKHDASWFFGSIGALR